MIKGDMDNPEDITQNQTPTSADDNGDNPADLSQIKIATGGNSLILNRLVEHLLNYYPGQLEEFKECLAADAWTRLMQLAHKFKGAVANFGARKAASYAFQLENASKNEDRELTIALIEKLEEEMSRVREYLTSRDREND